MAAPGGSGKGGAGAGAGAGAGGKGGGAGEKKEEVKLAALDASDIQLLKAYGAGPYAASIKRLETDIVDEMKAVNDLIGTRRDRERRPRHRGAATSHPVCLLVSSLQASRRARRVSRRPASGTSSAMRR